MKLRRCQINMSSPAICERRNVHARPRPQLLPTNMAFRDGLPATASATALFTLIFQRPVSTTFGPADFLIGGLSSTAYLRAVPIPGEQSESRPQISPS